MTADERTYALIHVYAAAPEWTLWAGRRRLTGVVAIVATELESTDTRDKRELLRRIRPRIKKAYGAFWVFILIRIAAIVIEWWLKREKECEAV